MCTRNLFLLAATAVSTRDLCHAFSLVEPRFGRIHRTRLFGLLGPSEEEVPDIELERSRLEALLNNGAKTSSSDKQPSSFLSLPMDEWKSVLDNPPPPLTAIGRERLQTEISLLDALTESDRAVQALWNLWESWGGHHASKQLYDAEALVMGGGDLDQAETILRDLIEQQGRHITWVDPLNRLAYLWYLQGKYEESRVLCEIALSVKPWHFGARSTIVLVLKALLQVNEMWDYSSKALPALKKEETNDDSPNTTATQSLTRQAWVEEMAQMAKAKFLKRQDQPSKERLQRAFQGVSRNDTQVGDAWQ